MALDPQHEIEPAPNLMQAIDEMEKLVERHLFEMDQYMRKAREELNVCMVRARDKAGDAMSVVALFKDRLREGERRSGTDRRSGADRRRGDS